MPKNAAIVKQLFDACMNKDFETARALMQPDYSLRDPVMDLHSAEEVIKMMESCPSDMKIRNLEILEAGDDKVVSLFESVMGEGSLRMCSVITMKDGKAAKEEMFYDTSKMPDEIKKLAISGTTAKHSQAGA